MSTEPVTVQEASKSICENLLDFIKTEFKDHPKMNEFMADLHVDQLETFDFTLFREVMNTFVKPQIVDFDENLKKKADKYDVELSDEQIKFIKDNILFLVKLAE